MAGFHSSLARFSGSLIAVEGLDGAGTTTQAKLLFQWLRRRGFDAHLTREPTDGPIGSLTRQALTKSLDMDRRTLALLFAADRVDHLYLDPHGIITRLADSNAVVVTDRYRLSFLAYQRVETEADLGWLQLVQSRCVPAHLTLYIDVHPEECHKRILAGRGFHTELFDDLERLQQVYGYFQEAIQYLRGLGENVQVIDGQGTPQQVHARARMHVEHILRPGYISRDEWDRVLDRNGQLKRWKESLQEEGLELTQIMRIQYGYQAHIAQPDGSVVHLTFYDSGRVTRPQGRAGQLLTRVTKVYEDLMGKGGYPYAEGHQARLL